MANKIDSNITGLRFAEESSLKVLGGSPIWYQLEPNSYNDFGGQVTTLARNPINSSRQRKKGVATDLDASGGFNQDLTFNNTTRLLQGFFFADIREKPSSAPMNSAAIAMTAIAAADDDYTAASGLPTTISAEHLLLASGFGVAANNGMKTASASSTATAISVVESLADEATPPSAAKVEVIGYQFNSGTSSITLNGSLVRFNDSAKDLTTLGLIAGEWVFIGGDGATQRFDNNQGFARISSITTGYLEFDKVSWSPSAETGTGDTIRMFFGSLLKNESNPTLIKRRTFQLERTLGNDSNGVMSEYLVGAVPNELTINIAQADKVTIDMSFVALDNEQRDGTTGVKSGSRPTLEPADALNTSTDFNRIKLALASNTDAAPVPLFGFATEMSLTVNNNVSPDKAIGVFGAFDTSAGTFEVGGSMTAYFSDVTSVQAVRNNSDVTIDFIMVKANKGILFDIPLLSLGDGRLSVEQDQSIKLPLETNAAESKFGNTLTFQYFPYLPNLA